MTAELWALIVAYVTIGMLLGFRILVMTGSTPDERDITLYTSIVCICLLFWPIIIMCGMIFTICWPIRMFEFWISEITKGQKK